MVVLCGVEVVVAGLVYSQPVDRAFCGLIVRKSGVYVYIKKT